MTDIVSCDWLTATHVGVLIDCSGNRRDHHAEHTQTPSQCTAEYYAECVGDEEGCARVALRCAAMHDIVVAVHGSAVLRMGELRC